MECVAPARSNLFVRQHLHALEKLGYRVLDCVLQLNKTGQHIDFVGGLWHVILNLQLLIEGLPPVPPTPIYRGEFFFRNRAGPKGHLWNP